MANDLKDMLELLNNKYQNSDIILGKNMLTLANRINSSRALMWGSQTDQIVPLKYAETPLVYTNNERIVGKYSSAYYDTQDELEVIRKIKKYPNRKDSNYILVVYNKRLKKYDIINRSHGEILTESYGYKYDNSTIDRLNEGENIPKGTVLYHSTSFDENMLYGYGVNALTYYTTDADTIEDAIKISESLAKRLISIEYGKVRISINDNDILLNMYGDKSFYKAFPDIGESIKDATVAVKRRVNYNHALFELKEENLRKILSTDTAYYVPFAEDKVVDISVYSNKSIDEIKDVAYNRQIIDYLTTENQYYEAIVNTLKPIIDHEKYTDDLAEVYNRATRILDPEIKWMDSNRKVFNNIILEIIVEKEVPVVIGSKLCGRYGDKGVTSVIEKDENMPIFNGRRVDCELNINGVGGRLNPGQVIEVELNFLGDEIRLLMKETDDMSVKEWYLFEFLKEINQEGQEKLLKWYKSLSYEDQVEFIQDCEENNIYKEQPAMYGNAGLEEIMRVYDRFNIKPRPAFIKKFGKIVKIMNDVVIGEKYIVKLKHHPKSKFATRSTGFINSKDQPTKTSSAKQSKSICVQTPKHYGWKEFSNCWELLRT